MDIETIPLADVADDPGNARRHSTWNLKSVRGSLERFGQQKPVVIDAAGTLIAAEQLKRHHFAMEIEPRFVDMICARYLKFTGRSPMRESDGASFRERQ